MRLTTAAISIATAKPGCTATLVLASVATPPPPPPAAAAAAAAASG
jgi:hypothetical protein